MGIALEAHSRFYIQTIKLSSGNGLGQPVKEILMVLFIYLFTWLQGSKAVEKSCLRIYLML